MSHEVYTINYRMLERFPCCYEIQYKITGKIHFVFIRNVIKFETNNTFFSCNVMWDYRTFDMSYDLVLLRGSN